jgi:UDP-N-acetylmuramoyl-L-alanyl-D-glutamate--2,6-diaminopimelate ligase
MYSLISGIVRFLKKIVPESMVERFRPFYHGTLAYLMALSYGFPSKKLTVIGVTGTKGKSTAADMLFAIFKAAGHKTALLSTIRFAIHDESEPNLYKMTLPGRGFAQAFMRKAVSRGCTHVIIEVTSESTLQFRHWFLDLDALIVTNIQREHVERHGSFENYVAAKRQIVEALARSSKPHHVLVSNADIPEAAAFLNVPGVHAISFSQKELGTVQSDDRHVSFSYQHSLVNVPLAGIFNGLNALACLKLAESLGIPREIAVKALATLPPVKGRVERIDAGQPFLVIVDYAHTPDSLAALYSAYPTQRKICVLGNTGGGRDSWKRPEMGRIADEHCETVILTNEDPYDEDSEVIVGAIAKGMRRPPIVIMDRREAIRAAIQAARPGDAVLISGKGTDPFIMGPNGTKTPWNDARVAREELERR